MTRETVAGTAVIVESNRDPGVKSDDHETYRDDGLLNHLFVAAAGMPYAFVVEVTVPGREPYQTSVMTRVPAKAEKVGLFESHPIPLTLEVPVVVDAADPSRVQIDWKAFLDLPDRVPRLTAARERALEISRVRRGEAEMAREAEQTGGPVGATAGDMDADVGLVRSGGLDQHAFVQKWMARVNAGHVTQDEFDAAVVKIYTG